MSVPKVHIWKVDCHHYHLILVDLVVISHAENLKDVFVKQIVFGAAQHIHSFDEIVNIDMLFVLDVAIYIQ